jgi:RNA-directed DNA polymerase
MESITRFITHRLKLKVNQAKSVVARPRQRKFLGFGFTSERESRPRIAPKAMVRFKERIREQTHRTRGISLTQMVKEIATCLRRTRFRELCKRGVGEDLAAQ